MQSRGRHSTLSTSPSFVSGLESPPTSFQKGGSTGAEPPGQSGMRCPSWSVVPWIRGGRPFNFGGGGGRYSPSGWTLLPTQKGSIDGPPKILPRLTPGPRR